MATQRPTSKTAIKFRSCWKQTVIYEVLKARGWVETESELEWDFFWSDVGWMYEFFDHIHLADHQVIFYFQGAHKETSTGLLTNELPTWHFAEIQPLS
ncbi:unnamed protein product [Sphagnum troendelagicum]|uniref:Uncharacterized protein n=1 Tax=Sphagnum troendelagicum TaxID=128251 RepID=A0ABP0U3N7_9BRYO